MAVQASRGVAPRALPTEVTLHELARAEELLFAEPAKASKTGAKADPKVIDGAAWTRFVETSASPKAARAEARAALAELLAAATEHGTLHHGGVEALAERLEHGAAKAVREMFDAVRTLKADGRFIDVRKTHELSPAILARHDAGQLTPAELKHVRRIARFELLHTFQHPVKDAAFREVIAGELKKKFQVRPKELEALEVPVERTLRETNTRASAALRVLVADPSISKDLRLMAVKRLALAGDAEALPALDRLAHEKDASLTKAAKAATAQIKKMQKMTVVFATMEAKPYCGTGGLSNVMNELPKALAKMGHKVVVLVPLHAGIDRAKLTQTEKTGVVYGGSGAEGFGLSKHTDAGVDYWFIENDRFFSKNRGGLYGDQHGDYGDNAERYDFFGAAIPVAIRTILGDKKADVVQLNDAHTAAGALYLEKDPAFAKTKTVMAVHNLGGAYQGKFDAHNLPKMRFDGLGLFYPGGPAEFHGEINLMKLGLAQADGVITVSREYMKEVLDEKMGEGLHGMMRWLSARDRLWGNLNGIDNAAWNPETDPLIPAHFSIDDLSGKATCKAEVQKRFGLAEDPDAALVGVVARLTNQKGFDDILDTIEKTMAAGKHAQFVVSGQGDQAIADQLRALVERYPGKVAFDPKFTVEKEHLVYAASDFFLMPSKFEPCGLPQMYALRYLTVPIVRAVGGLEESIQQFDEARGTGNGFKFTYDLGACMGQALAWYEQGADGRRKLLENCAASDFSWENSSAPEQLAFYRKLINEDLEV